MPTEILRFSLFTISLSSEYSLCFRHFSPLHRALVSIMNSACLFFCSLSLHSFLCVFLFILLRLRLLLLSFMKAWDVRIYLILLLLDEDDVTLGDILLTATLIDILVFLSFGAVSGLFVIFLGVAFVLHLIHYKIIVDWPFVKWKVRLKNNFCCFMLKMKSTYPWFFAFRFFVYNYSEAMDKKMTIQEKIKKKLIRTPIKSLNRHFNFSYIFTVPTPEEQ